MASVRRIAIIGAGGVGAGYASRFFEMDSGCVSFIAGGERGVRLRAEGRVVNGRHYAFPVIAPEDKVPPADLIIVAVKHHHLPEAIRDMRPLVGQGTSILSVMNGIDSEEQIGAAFGMDKVLYAVVLGIDALREGHRVTYSRQGRLFFGEGKNDVITERVKALQSLFDQADIAYVTPEDMIRVLWWKFMINVGINQVSAVLRAPYRVFHTSPEARELMEDTMREVLVLGEAAGVHLAEKDMQDFYPILSAMSPDGKTSMLQDVEAKRKTEVEMFGGKVIELGKRYGIPTPVNHILFRLVKAIEQYP